MTFRCEARPPLQCYVILNTVTDRAREHLDAFRMDAGADARARALVCALPADAILSYQHGDRAGRGASNPSVRTDMGEWIRFVEEASPG